jgi:hypothetical protein
MMMATRSEKCICKKKIIQNTHFVESSKCPAFVHKCVCRYRSDKIQCLAGKRKCNKHQIQKKRTCLCDYRVHHVECPLENKEDHVCICSKHFYGYLVDRPCIAIRHEVCLCFYYQKDRPISNCLANDEIDHLCLCSLQGPEFCRRKGNEHMCVCNSKISHVCKAFDKKHYCCCENFSPANCKGMNSQFHVCSCNLNVDQCIAKELSHKCICKNQGPKKCKAESYDHQCICTVEIDYDTMIAKYQHLYECRKKSYLHWNSLCICDRGYLFMHQCQSPNDKHKCTCDFNHRSCCRDHRISYQVWNLWKNENQYLYWIPEEVLIEIVLFLRLILS